MRSTSTRPSSSPAATLDIASFEFAGDLRLHGGALPELHEISLSTSVPHLKYGAPYGSPMGLAVNLTLIDAQPGCIQPYYLLIPELKKESAGLWSSQEGLNL